MADTRAKSFTCISFPLVVVPPPSFTPLVAERNNCLLIFPPFLQPAKLQAECQKFLARFAPVNTIHPPSSAPLARARNFPFSRHSFGADCSAYAMRAQVREFLASVRSEFQLLQITINNKPPQPWCRHTIKL